MKAGPSTRGVALQWFLGVLLAITLAAFFLSVAMVQLTSENSSKRILRRAVATITGIDSLLPQIEEDLSETVAANASERVQVPGFPIPVLLDREEATALRGAELRERLLDEAATSLYREGQGAWSSGDPDSSQSLQRFSTAGALHGGFGALTERNHGIVTAIAIALAVLTGALAIGLLLSIRSVAGITVLGVVTAGVSLLSLAGAIALHFIAKAAESQMDPFVGGLLAIAVDSMSVLIRDYSILFGLGMGLAGLGLFSGWLYDRPFRQAQISVDRRPLAEAPLSSEDVARRGS